MSMLSALSLLRFRSASKAWRSVIDSPHFIKLHLHWTLQTESDRKIVLRGNHLFWGDLDLAEKTNKIHYTKLDHCPFKNKGLVTNVIGSCHGVLCLGGDHDDDKTIALWNPTTREMLNVPSSKLPDGCRLGLGFGYDKASDDYKVLRIIQQRVDCGESEASVYGMGLKSWRKIDRFPFDLKYGISNGVLASGSLHFKCTINPEDENDVIVAFDLETEEYRLVPQPEFPAENGKDFHTNVEAFGGSLCTMCYYSESKSLDIWVMKEKCWRKVITIGESDSVWGSFLKVSYVRPVAYSWSGKEVFMAHADILPLWYDLDKRTMTYVGFNVSHKMAFMEHHLCCESLVKLS